MRKILSVCLAAVISLLCVGVYAAEDNAADNIAAAESDYRTDAVFQLGLLEEDVSGDRHLDEKTTRMEFAISLYRALNFKNMKQQPLAAESIYSDVDSLHYGAGYLKYLTDLGIVKGYSDGTFLPDKEVSLDEAYVMLVRSAGYFRHQDIEKEIINKTVDRIELTDKIRVENVDALTRKNVSHLLYNLLFADYAEFSGIEKNSIISKRTGEFLDVVMGLGYEDGVIYQYNGVSLYDESAKNDALTVNKLNLKNMTLSKTDWLGHRARVIYTKDTEEAIAIFAPKSNDVLTIESKRLDSYKNGVYEYYNTPNKTKKIRISDNADIVYNDYVCFDESKMVPKYGKIVLIDNTGDNCFDVVRIYEYESYLTDSVTAIGSSTELSFKNIVNDEHIIINTGDYDHVRVNDEWEDAESTLSRLKADTVVTVCRAGTKLLSVDTRSEVINVEQAAQHEDEFGEKTLILEDGGTYSLTPYVYVKGWDLKGKKDVTLYLDANGYVVAIMSETAGADWKYGYVLRCAYESGEESVYLKLLTQENDIKMYVINNKVILDGVKCKNMNDVYKGVLNAYEQFVNQDSEIYERVSTRLIRYYEKDGTISRLDTPIMQSLYDTSVPAGYSDNNKLMLRSKGKLYAKYVSGPMSFKTIYPEDAEILGEVNMTDKNAGVFVVPTTSDGSESEDEDYMATTIGQASIRHENWYQVSGYNLDPANLKCDVMVIRNDITAVGDDRMTIVNKIVEAVDKNGDIRYAVNVYPDGKNEETLLIMKNSLISGETLAKGDVIKYKKSGEEVYISDILYRPNGSEGALNIKPIPDGGNLNSESIVCTTVARKDSEWLQVKGPRQLPALIPAQDRILIYDAGSKTTTIGDSRDIRTEEVYGSGADVFIYYVDEYYVVDACIIRGEN